MHTSYFSDSGQDSDAVAICLHPPSWLPNIRHYPDLAPTDSLLRRWKAGAVSEEEYAEEYARDTLCHLDPWQVYQDLGDTAILCCYERSSHFCHRHLAAQWLSSELGIAIFEL